MSTRLRIPIIAFAALSLGLNIAILACAGNTLSIFRSERYTNPWYLTAFSSHFDTRELWALLGTSLAVVVLNLILIGAPFVANSILLLTAPALSFAVSLVAIIYASIVSTHTGSKTTLQDWTCRWRGVEGENVPGNYGELCHETRFAYYTTIPSLILQLLLLGMGCAAVLLARKQQSRGLRRLEGGEKDHELGDVRRSGSSPPESVRVLAGGQKA